MKRIFGELLTSLKRETDRIYHRNIDQRRLWQHPKFASLLLALYYSSIDRECAPDGSIRVKNIHSGIQRTWERGVGCVKCAKTYDPTSDNLVAPGHIPLSTLFMDLLEPWKVPLRFKFQTYCGTYIHLGPVVYDSSSLWISMNKTYYFFAYILTLIPCRSSWTVFVNRSNNVPGDWLLSEAASAMCSK